MFRSWGRGLLVRPKPFCLNLYHLLGNLSLREVLILQLLLLLIELDIFIHMDNLLPSIESYSYDFFILFVSSTLIIPLYSSYYSSQLIISFHPTNKRFLLITKSYLIINQKQSKINSLTLYNNLFTNNNTKKMGCSTSV